MKPMTLTGKLSGNAGVGEPREGVLIVSRMGFNARYDLDLATGMFSRPEHDLYGRSLADRIFVFDGPKGGIATSWALGSLAQRGLAPRALIAQQVNPVIVQGAVLAGIPLITGLAPEDMLQLKDGMRVRVEPEKQLVTILEPEAAQDQPRPA